VRIVDNKPERLSNVMQEGEGKTNNSKSENIRLITTVVSFF